MDRPANVPELFSRGSTPPSEPQFQRLPYSNPPPHPSNTFDTLFHGISTTQQHSGGLPPGFVGAPNVIPEPPDDGLLVSSQSQNTSERDRQHALLNLLGTVSPSAGQSRTIPPATSQNITQIPTPPGTTNTSESQGKYLLDQLMSNREPNYSDPPRSLPASGPSPPYLKPSPPAEEPFLSRDVSYPAHEPPRETNQRPQLPEPPKPQPLQQQAPQQPPSPSRKSMFEYTNPFDALAATTTSGIKKKVVPPTSSSSGNEDWTSASLSSDAKRKSVENLVDTLTKRPRPQAVQPPPQGPLVAYEPYASTEDYSQPELGQTQGPVGMPAPPLLPKPGSPTRSSPKMQAPRQQPPRSGESPIGQASLPSNILSISNRRESKDGAPAPAPRSGPKVGKVTGQKNKSQTSPPQQYQHRSYIEIDVSQPLDHIQAPPDTVKSTAIALVKQDSVFLPGTTIGATHWVAYAMTRGRVRVISRSSGDRTLLQLPGPFSGSSAVTDMAVYGNRLAGVTSDGGFVVWELPEVITDDVPGQLLLCLPPTSDSDALHSVKWHPKQPDTLAVASQTTVYLIDLLDAPRISRGQPISHADLHRISQVFSVSSRIVAFDFDVAHYAIATISEDSSLMLWHIRDQQPFWTHHVRGEDAPSSITFIDGGIVVGRKNGTIFQVLSVATKTVLTTIKFVNETEDPGMFGHVNYDTRIHTLWVANNRRDSMIALKFGFDPRLYAGDENRVYLEQIVEFVGPKPTIHFVILTADADPTGEEAHAACVAAKVPPGELALVAFSVHSSGVDQIMIRKEWYESALALLATKSPPYTTSSLGPRNLQPSPVTPHALAANQPRSTTPPSEDVEGDYTRDDGRVENGRKAKARNLGWREKDEIGKDRERATKQSEASVLSDSALGQALSKEIRKTEESLHTRIGRLIGKEMDKQHQRLEDSRVKEQAEDFARQEKILKLISTELTRNTTRVVEVAVKNEVQNSVLPALESITQTEVKAALNERVGKNMVEFIQQNLPMEIEKLLLRPDVSSHFAHILSSQLTPLIERHIKEAINKSFLPVFSQQTNAMHQDLLRELRAEILNVKKELFAVQSDAFRSQESLIRELEHTVRSLSDQVKFLSLNTTPILPMHHHVGTRSSPVSGVQHAQGNIAQHPLRQPAVPPAATNYGQNYQQSPAQPLQPIHGTWYPPSIAAPQASHPAAPPAPAPATLSQRTPPAAQEEWDDTYLAVLGTQDPRQLRELLSRSNPDVIMPLNSKGPLSQAVVLTLLHRLASAVGETSPVDDSFKSSLWWLQRTASTLNTNDPLISPYIARVVPTVQQMLNTTKQRLSIIPGGPQLLDAARTISEVQDTLNRKPM